MKTDRPQNSNGKLRLTGDLRESLLSGAIIAGSLWLAWQIIVTPLAVRAAPELALRVAPSAPSVLRRAAESEYAAKRFDNARDLAATALARAPFDAAALRVFGLTEARQANNQDRADQLITQAGNWSLRDDPAHAWLIERRLRQGDYVSAFAHADTLVRRKKDQQAAVFKLYTTAATTDPRSIPALTRLLAANPPWRMDYMNSLIGRRDAGPLQAALALGLQRSDHPMTRVELGLLYSDWLSMGRLAGIAALRSELNRPPVTSVPTNGSFELELAMGPLDWQFATGPRFSAVVTPDDLAPSEKALRIEARGDSEDMYGQQLLLLKPGHYRVTGRVRTELGETPGAGWSLLCFESGTRLAEQSRNTPAETPWKSFSFTVLVPQTGCSAQWLRLAGQRRDGIQTTVAWFDDLAIQDLKSASQPSR